MRHVVIMLLFMAASPRALAAPAEPVLVAVASNFTGTCEKIAAMFTEAHGAPVQISSGSTGKLVAQIVNGGPYHLFLSADTAHVAELLGQGAAIAGTRRAYAIGRLALYSASRAVNGDAAWLQRTEITHLAIANPETAPYGKAAVEALTAIGLWDTFKERIVYGENIAQTYQFVQSGAADAGIVAYAQVIGTAPEHYWLVPAGQHAELRQDAVLLNPGKESAAAKAFIEFLSTDKARALIAKSGYDLPSQQLALRLGVGRD